MIKIAAILTAAALMAGATVSANAQDAGSAYGQIGAGQVDADGEKFGVINLTGGYNFNRNFAVEGEVGIGVTEKTYMFGSVNVDAKIKHTVGAYVVGSLPLAENLDLVGRAGFVNLKVEATVGDVSANADDSGIAYGVGLRYFPNGGVHGVRGDFTRYNFNDENSNAVQVSYVRRF